MLNPNIENSIDCQKAPESEPVQSAAKDLTGFHLVSCGQDESLVITCSSFIHFVWLVEYCGDRLIHKLFHFRIL